MADWIKLPSVVYRSAPGVQMQANQLKKLTNLALRPLARMVGTSHVTLGNLARGQATELARRPEVRQRLENLYRVAERLEPLALSSGIELGDLLQQPSTSTGVSLGEMAAKGEYVRAYMEALKLIGAPSRATEQRRRPVKIEGTATIALDD